MDNTITARFMRVRKAHPHNMSFPDALAAAIDLGDLHHREKNISINATPLIVRLERLVKRGDYVFGELIRKQISNIPPEANDAGLSPIRLRDGGGLGLSSAFRYHIPTQVLLIQSNAQAVTYGRLIDYLHAVDPLAQYEMDAVPREDAWERFNSGVPRKFKMKIASPTASITGLENEAEVIGTGVANIGEALRGAYITIEVSMGTKKGSLAKAGVSRVIRALKRADKEHQIDVRQLGVSIKESDGDRDVIDFLDEHLTVREDIDLPEDRKSVV